MRACIVRCNSRDRCVLCAALKSYQYAYRIYGNNLVIPEQPTTEPSMIEGQAIIVLDICSYIFLSLIYIYFSFLHSMCHNVFALAITNLRLFT